MDRFKILINLKYEILNFKLKNKHDRSKEL